jgi:hypothetical protein
MDERKTKEFAAGALSKKRAKSPQIAPGILPALLY